MVTSVSYKKVKSFLGFLWEIIKIDSEVTFKSQDNKLNLEKKVTITQTKEVKYVAKEVDLGLSILWSEYNPWRNFSRRLWRVLCLG